MTDHGSTKQKRNRGFSLLEMMLVVAVMLVMMGIASPFVMHVVYSTRLRYSSVDLSGLLQKARMEAARKNTYYSVGQTMLGSGEVGYFVDLSPGRTGNFATLDPLAELGSQITVHPGTGSGAPNEAAFVASLNFTPEAGGALPSFNSRGLPCVPANGVCSHLVSQGFVFFLNNVTMLGTSNWASVVVTPSGRVQTWTYNGSNWVQQ